VISHRFRCVFVHIPKCGGQSVETVFVEQHGLTWETRAPLLLRPCSDRRFGPRFLAHLTAREYVELGHLSPADYAEYFSFAVIRSPWDRMLSTYRYRGQEGVGFREWIRDTAVPAIEDGHFFYKTQVDYLCDRRGDLIVDEVLRLDDLPGAFDPIRQRLGIPGQGLPHVNASRRHPGLTSAAAYDGETEALVGQLYAQDVERWGFLPPSAAARS
jgi:Sulfotransferase family